MDPVFPATRDHSALVIIDVQEKLHKVIPDSHFVIRNVTRLATGMATLGVPIIVTEQYPKGVGPTTEEIKEVIGDAPIVEKREFGCFANAGFSDMMKAHSGKTLILCGFEAHVCVLQTALQALRKGHKVVVVADAVSSRSPQNRDLGVARLRQAGCVIVSVEMILFELVESSTDAKFKTISALIK